ncbi:hypothetical protein MAPG_06106 [Magnaporthiopsis poae ATCC 64411]|uniref:Uncharacterized protein n=1 Tax=Magnaporthiopsis poae (strain ATCC 64411 / 73-15) TaxID=644358 RepID=A0A0C4E157_MAGP6|nr:hypothetical protein MAPG_06106 [Magnaporthiopsis poae ATCC 64411]
MMLPSGPMVEAPVKGRIVLASLGVRPWSISMTGSKGRGSMGEFSSIDSTTRLLERWTRAGDQAAISATGEKRKERVTLDRDSVDKIREVGGGDPRPTLEHAVHVHGLAIFI